MSSPPEGYFTSSPLSIRGESLPVDISRSPEDPHHPHSLARHSPTLSRSFDPNDEDARERQRAMDVDSALQLSRARSASMATPARPSLSFSARDTSPTISPRRSGDVEPLFPMLSSHEEEEMNFARGEYDDEALHHPPQPQHDLLDILANHHDPMLSPIMQSPNIADVQNDPMLGAIPIDERSESGGMGGLPTYQPNNYHYTFDFGHMENFGAEEKERMGIMSSSRGLSSASRIISRPTTSTADLRRRTSQLQQSNLQIPGDGAPLPELGTSELPNDPTDAPGPFLSRRQRKLSQSHHPPRRQGKLALFEGANTNGPVSLIPGISVMKSSSLPNDARFNPPFPSDTRSPLQISTSGHDRPYRFSFYSNALAATVHARSLAELPAEGQSFEDLFLGRSPHEGGPTSLPQPTKSQPNTPASFDAGLHTGGAKPKDAVLGNAAQKLTENSNGKPGPGQSLMHDIEANTWWLDVLCPTDEEMGMLSKVFGIHPLTTEDIQMEETREKIELFRNYYFVCFRSFDQDPYSPTHLEPLNMYIIVFREGTLSFHFRGTPHPQNVRRRIKQLKDYISVTSDWISYALIDDITDAFGPLIQSIEYEVDSIDELVLILKEAEQSDMLRRIGTCRKKVMGLLRLMGNKADVVKGLAKRCNENWTVAPKSDIGLYLSDIQDHLITMTQNLNHYEKILSRSHSNYLAQISIEMTDANNQINDVLSKLTALGTILIPMNLITGLWGMNVHVPGQDVSSGYTWFLSIVGALAGFALIGSFLAYKLLR